MYTGASVLPSGTVFMLPNAAPQPRPESAAQRRLKGVGCRRWFGSSVAPIVELVAEPLIA